MVSSIFLQAIVSVLDVCQHLFSIWCLLYASCSICSSHMVVGTLGLRSSHGTLSQYVHCRSMWLQCVRCSDSVVLWILLQFSGSRQSLPFPPLLGIYIYIFFFFPLSHLAWCGGLLAWLQVGQASQVSQRLENVTAVAAPGVHVHLPFTSDLGIKFYLTQLQGARDICQHLLVFVGICVCVSV